MFKPFPEKLEHVSAIQQYEETLMISERVKKQQVPKEDDRSAIHVFKLDHLYLINSFLMHSNWSHNLQEVFNSGKFAERSYHQNSKTYFLFGELAQKSYQSEFQNPC